MSSRTTDGQYDAVGGSRQQGVSMARFNNGWVKVWREAWDKDLSQNIHLWGLWHAFLCMATWRETQIIWNGKQRVLPPGSVIFGMHEIATKFECSPNTIRKWVLYLHETGRIVYESCTRGSIATICNWESYQIKEKDDCEPTANEVQTSCKPAACELPLIEEGKKVRSIYTPEFEKIWDLLSEGTKQKAFKAYQKEIRTDQNNQDLLKALNNYTADCDLKNRFRMHLSSFIGSDRTTHPWLEWINRAPQAHSPKENVVSKILDAVTKFKAGRQLQGEEWELHKAKIENYVGSDGWQLIKRFGGWQRIHECAVNPVQLRINLKEIVIQKENQNDTN